MRIAIVGGGISGLTAAHLLAARAHDVVVIDDGAAPGGLIASARRDGFLCERGPQALLDGAPEVRALLASSGLAERAMVASPAARRRFVYVDGALRPFPSSPPGLVKTNLFGWRAKLRLFGEPFVKRAAPDGAREESVLDFVARRFGPEAAQRAAAPALIGIYAGDAAQLSVRAALPRLAAMEHEHGSVLRALFRRRGGPGLGQATSFPDGLGELPAALARSLAGKLVGARAVAIEPLATGGWRVITATGAAVEAERLILATPAAATAALLAPLAPDAAAALTAIPHAPVAVVCLGFRDGHDLGLDLDAYGFVAARSERLQVLGCQYDSSVFPGRAPTGGVLLRALLGGTFDPAAVDTDDDTLATRAAADLQRATGLRRAPDFVDVWRARPGIPQYDLEHRARVRATDGAVARLPGLSVIGNALRGVGLVDSVRAACQLAASFGA
ncbi:MAG TPA: protoporphyrinogen oxidase [Polyangia bacterium]|nr:protoporphyrinogen oxidase [Polyangia bacterium]